MNIELSSSQKTFIKNIFSPMWNHGEICFFLKKYSCVDLNEAINSLVKTFESLRLCSDGKESTFLDAYHYCDYPFYNFSNKEDLYLFAKEFINKPFNKNEPLSRFAVFEVCEVRGIILCAHHLSVDGFSGVLAVDYINSYLKGFPIYNIRRQQYEEYIKNEKTYKISKRYLRDKKFWSQQFSYNPQCSMFEEKKNSFDYASAEVDFRICPELFNSIKLFCDGNSISVQSYFNTLISIYIYRTFAMDCFVIGVPVLNRTTEIEFNSGGLYMHILPMLVNVSDKTFLQTALDIEDAQLNLFRHQKFTQYDIKELLKEEGKPHNNLFDIATDYQEFEENEDYKFEFIYSNYLSVPLEIHMQSFRAEKHNLKIRYRTSMFSEKEIQTMMNSIIAMAEDAVENPDKKISELEMLSTYEKHKILREFNDTHYDYNLSDNSTLFSLFEKAAKENKGKLCIKTAEKKVTFGELLNFSENLDIEIRRITKDRKSVIAVIAERSVEMYAAVYGIVRGGNSYLPIDPDYPKDRIDYILNNSKATAVVVQGKYAHLTENLPCINMTNFISKTDVIECVLPCAANPDDTAYVIYTSGSTGNPKGAKISHKSAVNRILWMHDKYPLGAEDVILQKTPYTFDVSVWELFWWGMCGGSLAVSKPGEHFLPAKILEETHNNNVTHLHFVPSVFELFLNYLESHKDELYKFHSVRYVFLSGEALSANLVQRFYNLYDYNKVTLHNLYGPTECAVDVTYYDCNPDDADPVPIGKPIYNTQMYVVDEHNKAVPIGVTGELCIAGMNVGQGYLNNPELTAEKFIDNPFGEGKLYKTGDLAYWREDGNIIFCGRKDHQIKLGGQRLEIGEIECVIGSLDEVDSVAVIIKKVASRDILIAFYTGKSESEEKIKEHCFKKMPRYMVPGVVVHLEKMPLNHNGKLDRKILAQTDFEVEQVVENEIPINESEKIICETFRKILGKEDIGRNTNFFDIGGTSLSMISVLSESVLESVTAAEFMRNPTPAMLAEVLKKKAVQEAGFLEALYIPESSKQTLILLPFAGGGAEAFSNFVVSLKNAKPDTAVYFIRYLHSTEECRKAAEEIASFFGGTDILFYSHCVGSAVALNIILYLESKGVSVKHYFAAASIPPSKPTKNNIWNNVSDKIIYAILKKAGAELGGFSQEKQKELLSKFRKDTDFANVGFFEFRGKIKSSATVILSKKDIFTLNYRNTEKNWKKYVSQISDVYYIDSNSHYFQSESSNKLVRLLFR